MLEKIKEILVEQLNCDADSINEDTSFKDDLGADSLDLYEMVMALEDEYGIEIDTDELTDLSTVGDFMEYLKQHGVEVRKRALPLAKVEGWCSSEETPGCFPF